MSGAEGDVWVVGSINMDVVVGAPRHPAAGETILGDSIAFHPGGKGANQAVAAARLGARARLVGSVGRDPFADAVVGFLSDNGVDVEAVARVGEPTGVASIVVAAGENTIVVAPGANAAVSPESLGAFAPRRGDVVLCQMEIPPAATAEALARGRASGATTILNAAPAHPHAAGLRADLLVVNATELANLSGRAVTDTSETDDIIGAMGAIAGARTVVATLGARGAVALADGAAIEIPAHAVDAVDPTGAGDCFVGALAATIAAGGTLERSLRMAAAAAALSVRRPGAGPSMPRLAEVEALATRAP